MFRYYAQSLRFRPEEGMQVIARGKISVYAKDGSYSLNVVAIEPDGVGSLAIAFDQLKKKLAAEGLFDEARKKPIPRFPRRVGVITSTSGAALRDILNITKRRYPLCEILICPATVQGSEAPQSLVRAINRMSALRVCDVLIIGRGGGSMEDLWCFNDEGLARAIAACPIPVISAVGHETDFTISDFVADLRAPTPSAAAELALPDVLELKKQLRLSLSRMTSVMEGKIRRDRDMVRKVSSSYYLQKPDSFLEDRKLQIDRLADSMLKCMNYQKDARRNSLKALSSSLNALSPLSVLSRGYSIVYDEKGDIVKRSESLKPGNRVSIVFGDGISHAEIVEDERGEVNDHG
ncbi:MAG: exodeoxyribonuclease VII large subunit, partial [Clostridia bacterium]|nr:exodeoxyribonuclease VII large subunit [Clostridia bacterium]